MTDEVEHLFIPQSRLSSIRNYIALQLMKKAGKAYEHGNEALAKKYKECSEMVSKTEMYEESKFYNIEVSKEWLKDLYEFIKSKPDVLE